jgi:preprotein translocase subunit SecG
MLKQSIVVTLSASKKILIPLCHDLIILIIKGEIEDDSDNKEEKGESYVERGKQERLFLLRGLAVVVTVFFLISIYLRIEKQPLKRTNVSLKKGVQPTSKKEFQFHFL